MFKVDFAYIGNLINFLPVIKYLIIEDIKRYLGLIQRFFENVIASFDPHILTNKQNALKKLI